MHSTLPASAAAGVASAVFLAKRLGYFPRALQPLSANLLGWTATLLFMFQPLAQLVRLLMDVRQNALCGDSTVIYLCMVKRPCRNPTMAILSLNIPKAACWPTCWTGLPRCCSCSSPWHSW